MSRNTACLISLVMLSLLVSACGVTAPTRNDGFADLDSLGFRDVDQTMSLSIGPTVLKFAANNMHDDPQTRDMMLDLDGVRVKTYDVTGDEQRVAERIDGMSRKLQGQGWVPVISVREPGERTVMLMKVREETILGLTVINSDSEEAVIVNVMGELRPQSFASAMANLDLDVPGMRVAHAD
jgi:hypothetical protein